MRSLALIVVTGRGKVRCVTREAQKDVVQRRASKSDVVYRDLSLIEVANHLDESLRPTVCRHREPASMVIYRAFPISVVSEHLDGS